MVLLLVFMLENNSLLPGSEAGENQYPDCLAANRYAHRRSSQTQLQQRLGRMAEPLLAHAVYGLFFKVLESLSESGACGASATTLVWTRATANVKTRAFMWQREVMLSAFAVMRGTQRVDSNSR